MGHQPRRAQPAYKRAGLVWLREILITLLIALLISTLTRAFVVRIFEIPSGSMENTLLIGDRVAVQKVSSISRGDIVVFRDRQGWLGAPPPQQSFFDLSVQFLGFAPDKSANFLIKRAVGMPGDRVKCCDEAGRMTVNGVALDESEYLFKDRNGTTIAPSDLAFDVEVPAGHIFVMGDHRNNSQDSRCYLNEMKNGKYVGVRGFIPLVDVEGSAVAVVMPFNRWQSFSKPAVFQSVPEPSAAPPTIGKVNEPIPKC